MNSNAVSLFSAAQFGLQTGSGVTVGVLGSLVGAHWSLAISALVLLFAVLVLFAYVRASLARASTVPSA